MTAAAELPSKEEISRDPQDSRFRKLLKTWLWLLKVVILSMMIAWTFRSVVFAPYYVPSSSMLPSLREGDFFIASRWDYGVSPRSFANWWPDSPHLFKRLPKRGDVVVFSPEGDTRTNYVKRVIGIPGDRIEMRDGVLIINGTPVGQELIDDFIIASGNSVSCIVLPPIIDQRATTKDGHPGCRFGRTIETLPNGVRFPVLDIAPSMIDTIPEFVVPEGRIFVAGDNRDNSLDSRIPIDQGGVGLVKTERLLGRLRFVVGSNATGSRFIGKRAIAAD